MIPRSSIRPRPRLYILTPAVSDEAALSGVLAEIFGAVDVASVLLRLPDADERSLINKVKAAAGGVQGAGAALLVDGRPDIVGRAGADGAHLAGPDALQAAIRTLKPNYIAGADYVMFGEPDAAGAHPSGDAVIDRVAWWAEVFEIPCVAHATALDDIDA